MVAISGLTIDTCLQNGKWLITACANKKSAQKDLKSTVDTYTYIEEVSEKMKVNIKEEPYCSDTTRKLHDIPMLYELPVIMENIRAECSWGE